MSDTIRTVKYHRRIVDDEISDLISGGAAALSIEGAKAIGKSATAAERATVQYLLEVPVTRQLLAADPSRIVNGDTVLIDEWQHVPTTWDVVRRAVDNGAPPGKFLLTGSATSRPPIIHSGAGRILSVRMRPMTLAERGLGQTTVSLAELLRGGRSEVRGSTGVGLSDYVDEIVRSGFPAIREMSGRVRRTQLLGYIDRIIDHDFHDVTGRSLRNPTALRRWFAAYAAATATSTSFEKIRDAATGGDNNKPAKTTTGPYRDALEALYLLEPLAAWSPSHRHISELAHAPKHHLVDPALATAILGLGPRALLSGQDGGVPMNRDGAFLGSLFESVVTLDVRVFAQAAEAHVGHLRTHRGEHEVDLIVERSDGRVLALEVKLSGTVDDDDVRHLHWLREQIGDDLLDAALITTGPHAYRRPDGIAVIPAALLGP
jgi:predicted AAA+ superfamily ATPase